MPAPAERPLRVFVLALPGQQPTPERLAMPVREQDGRVAILSPEGGFFDLGAGRN